MHALIIEDEKLVAQELIAGIAEVDPSIHIIGTVTSVKTGLRWLSENAEPDVIFADIQLSDGVSFDIFDRFKLSCPVIFTTAYNEYAIQAFRANGIDYLLKPVDWEELKRAIDKARAIARTQSTTSLDMQKLIKALSTGTPNRPTYKSHFLGNARNSWIPIRVDDVAYFFRDQLIFMVTTKGERYILDYDSLDELETMLDPDVFYRATRYCHVNRNAVLSVKGLASLKLQVALRPPNHTFALEISRDKAPSFKKWLEQ